MIRASSSSQLFPYSGSPLWMSLLHSLRLCTAPSSIFFSLKSFLIQSFHLVFGLPLPLVPSTSISIASLPTCSSPSLLFKCPYHLILDSCIFLDTSTTFTVPLIYSFLILSLLVTPTDHLSIFISATSIFLSSS